MTPDPLLHLATISHLRPHQLSGLLHGLAGIGIVIESFLETGLPIYRGRETVA